MDSQTLVAALPPWPPPVATAKDADRAARRRVAEIGIELGIGIALEMDPACREEK